MYIRCSTEKAAVQQRKFEECMMDLMLQYPYDAISISQLCREAGLSRKTFYRLFENKSDVIYAMVDHTIMGAEFYESDESVGPGGMHHFFGYWRTQEKFLDALAENNISTLLTQRAIQHILRESPDVMHSFGTEDSEFGRETMLFFISGLFALLLDWHMCGFDRTIDQMSALMMQILMLPPIKNPLAYDPYRTLRKSENSD